MRRKSAGGVWLLAVVLVLGMLTGSPAVSSAEEQGSYLLHEVSPSEPADGGHIAVESTADFATAGGIAIFEPGTAAEESFSYTGVDEPTNHLIGVSRENPTNHPAGSFVGIDAGADSSPAPTASPSPAVSGTPEEAASPTPSASPAGNSVPAPTSSGVEPAPDGDSGDGATGTADSNSGDAQTVEEENCATVAVCGLEVAEQEKLLTGAFSYVGSFVTFTSELTGPGAASLSLDVNGVRLESKIDMATGSASWSGGGHALFSAERDALVAFSYELERQFVSSRDHLLAHEHLLHRSVLLWAEAPLGEPLLAYKVAAPEEIMDWLIPPSDPGVPTVEDCLEQEASTSTAESSTAESDPLTDLLGETNTAPVDNVTDSDGSSDSGGTTVAGACQRADDDGIRYWGCNAQVTSLDHDAKHCFLTQTSKNVGPCTNKCKGRCGPGCGSTGAGHGTYARDCGEHDQCCRIHGGCANPWDSECGDEYFDADDDFMFGRVNCHGCNNPAPTIVTTTSSETLP